MKDLSLDPQKRFLELDALRGLAAMLVVMFHYSMNYSDLPVYRIFKYGITGVDLFFLISGFVIFQSIKAANSGTEFLINRLTRLYPTYWVAVTFTAFIIYLSWSFGYTYKLDWGLYWKNMTMFQLYFGVNDLDGSYWTMCTEMLFYLIMFVLLVSRLIRFVIPVFIGLIALTLLASKYRDTGGEMYWDYWGNFPLSQYIPLFFAGILFYKITVENERKWRFYILIAACWASQILLFNYCGRNTGYMLRGHYVYIISSYFIIFFLFSFHKLKWIVNPVTLYLGKISFPLYLIHQFFSVNFLIQELINRGFNYYVAAYLVALPTCILIASLFTFTVERKFSPLLRKWLKRLLLVRLPNYLNSNPNYLKIRTLLNRF